MNKVHKKILCQQMKLLAEESQNATDNELANISIAMCKIYETLNAPIRACLCATYFFSVSINLVICFLIFF